MFAHLEKKSILQHAFSLVELSIVLVILGLLTGGILAGKSLIRASELRSVAADTQRFTTATQAFRDKYFGLPGDITNATSFWGTAAACPGTVQSTDATTCNGNGDNLLLPYGGGNLANEWFRFWQHLTNAGLIEGQYGGVAGSGGLANQEALAGINVPTSRIGGAGYSVYRNAVAVTADGAGQFISPAGNFLYFGTYFQSGMMERAIKPEEAWNIDAKLDDGKPSTGRVTTPTSSNAHGGTNCVTTNVAATADYVFSDTGYDCAMLFWIFGK